MLKSTLARYVRTNPRLRPLGVAGYRLYTRLGPSGDGPRVLANSIPKAGTHVLMSLLDATPGMRFNGNHFAFTGADRHGGSEGKSLQSLRSNTAQLRTGQYMTGHIRHRDDIVDVLAGAGVRTLLSIRDPRAIALSAANYLHANPRHPLHSRVLAEYPELDDRIRAVIDGIPATESSPGIPGLAERLDRYLPWLDEPAAHVVRYEDLVGAQGGGSTNTQRATVAGLLSFLGLDVDDAGLGTVCRSVYSTKSATFRSGQSDSWRAELAPEHAATINDRCAAQLTRLGYPPA